MKRYTRKVFCNGVQFDRTFIQHMNDVHSTSGFAAERYLLGELSAEERDRFEEHFFSCPECADRVLAAVAFVENAKAVLPELDRAVAPVPAPSPKKPFNWFPWSLAPQAALACLVLLAAITAYQNAVEIPHLRASAASEELVISGARVLTARRAASDLAFSVRSPVASVVVANEWEENFPRYASEIVKDPASEVVLSSSPVAASGSLVISIPTARLGEGKYTMILYGVPVAGSRQVVARHPFTIQE
jgi:hypothetical protein